MSTVGRMLPSSTASSNAQQQMLASSNGHPMDGGEVKDIKQDSNSSAEPLVMNAESGGGEDEAPAEDEEPPVDISINNVVCNFSVRCHLNLRTVAMTGANVVYKREQGMVSMKIRKPKVTASIWSSGKITVTGATSDETAMTGGRRVARILQKMGFRVRFSSYRVVNVLGTVILPFGIKIAQLTQEHPRVCSYEPELHPGATYRHKDSRGVLKIFQTGAITCTAPSIANIQLAIEHIYPLVYEFKKEKPVPVMSNMKKRKLLEAAAEQQQNNNSNSKNQNKRFKKFCSDSSGDEEEEVGEEFVEPEAEFTSGDEEDLDGSYYSDKSDN